MKGMFLFGLFLLLVGVVVGAINPTIGASLIISGTLFMIGAVLCDTIERSIQESYQEEEQPTEGGG